MVKEKPSRPARLRTYFLRRLRPETSANAAHGLLREGWARSFGALRREDFSLRRMREAWEAKENADAAERFSEMMRAQQVTPSDLERSARIHSVICGFFGLAAAVSFVSGLSLILLARDFTWVASGLPLALLSFVFLALSLRHAHARWQVTTRSFGSFRKWLGRTEK
jgi:hypothetical protein